MRVRLGTAVEGGARLELYQFICAPIQMPTVFHL